MIRTDIEEYLARLKLGSPVYFKDNGQVYMEKLTAASPEELRINDLRFDRETGIERTQDDVPLDERAQILFPTERAVVTFQKHKKRRLTSAHVKKLVNYGVAKLLDENCIKFLRDCYSIFDEKLSYLEPSHEPLHPREIEQLSLGELQDFFIECVEQDLIEETSEGHAEFVARVLNEKAALRYVEIVSSQ